MKKQYDRRRRVKLVDLKVGDHAYRKNRAVTTTRGPWEAEPFEVTHVYGNQITGKRGGQVSTRDRQDWKKVERRPDHLQPTEMEVTGPARRPAEYGGGPATLLDPNMDWTPGIKTRNQTRREATGTTTTANTPRPPATPPRSPDNTRKNRNICDACGTMFKLDNGQRTCSCVAGREDLDLVYDGADTSLRIEKDDKEIGKVAYIRGLNGHPMPNRPDIQAIVRAAFRAGTTMSPATSSDSEEDAPYQVIQSEEEGEVTERERDRETEDTEEEENQLALGAEDRAHGAEGVHEDTDEESEEERRNEGRQRRKDAEKRKRQTRRNTSTGYNRLDGDDGEESEHEEGPPQEDPNVFHQQGEADPRADDPEPEDEVEDGHETSPMHTRSGRTWGPQEI